MFFHDILFLTHTCANWSGPARRRRKVFHAPFCTIRRAVWAILLLTRQHWNGTLVTLLNFTFPSTGNQWTLICPGSSRADIENHADVIRALTLSYSPKPVSEQKIERCSHCGQNFPNFFVYAAFNVCPELPLWIAVTPYPRNHHVKVVVFLCFCRRGYMRKTIKYLVIYGNLR